MVTRLNEQWWSQSRKASADRCGKLYEIREIRGLRPLRTPAPLRTGTMVHAGFEAAAHAVAQGTDPKAAEVIGAASVVGSQADWLESPALAGRFSEADTEAAMDQAHRAVDIFQRAWRFLGIGRDWDVLCAPDGEPMIEYPISTPGTDGELTDWAGFRGTIDLVLLERATGNTFVTEIKTTKQRKPPGYYKLQTQLPAYVHLLRTWGYVIAGTMTVEVFARVPETPKQNKPKKDGTVSLSRAACTTTRDVYLREIEALGLNPTDYADVLAKLPEHFDRIEKDYRSETEVQRTWEDILAAAERTAYQHHNNLWPRAATPFTCQGCGVRSLCDAELHGEDVDYLLANEYTDEPDRYADIPTIIVED